MLRKFCVENYKNFQKRLILDFTAVRDYEYNKECVKDGLLSKILLMGPNGCGKTNLGYAMFDIVYTLTDNRPHQSQADASAFINGDGSEDHAQFKYEFQNGDDVIEYMYRKTAPNSIIYEHLLQNGELIFRRDLKKNTSDYKGLNLVNAQNLRIDPFGGSLSLLRFIANNTTQPDGSPVSFIMNFVKNMLYFRSTQDGNTFIGFERVGENIDEYIMKNNLVQDFEKFLKECAGLDMNLGVAKVRGMPDIFVQKTKKKNLAFNSVASSGTKALELFYYWSKRFSKVSLLFIDEFDAYYHFKLAGKIMEQLIGYEGVQVMLTSHNSNLVSNKMMRPDCYLCLKNGELRSFAGSTDRELREGHNLEKMLRNGEFE